MGGGRSARDRLSRDAAEVIVNGHVAATERDVQPEPDRESAVRGRVLGIRRDGFPEGGEGAFMIEVEKFGRCASAQRSGLAVDLRGLRAAECQDE